MQRTHLEVYVRKIPVTSCLCNKKQGKEETNTELNKQTQEHSVKKDDDEAENHNSLTFVVVAVRLWLPSFSGVTLASHLQEALITM